MDAISSPLPQPALDNSRDIGPPSVYRPQIMPTLLSRIEAFRAWPMLAALVCELNAHCRGIGERREVIAMVVRNRQLTDESPVEPFGSALVVCLPECLEPYLGHLAVQEPYACNWQTLDLMRCETVCLWEVRLETGAGWWLLFPAIAIEAAVDDCLGACDRQRPPVVCVPVIMLAGDSVATGGFWVGETWDGILQCAEISSGVNWRPYRVFNDEEFEKAAKRAEQEGSAPWEAGFWRNNNGILTIEPAVFDFRAPTTTQNDGDCSCTRATE